MAEVRTQTAFAKTTRPATSAIMPRERLFQRLDGQPGRTAAWISGPAGTGKTSLAASYLEARRYKVLWYQIDPDDADVATFFHFLGHAARKLEAVRGRELPAYRAQYAEDVSSFARKFFREFFSRSHLPIALVLDNLHHVGAEAPLHGVLDAALTQVPKHCCVLVTSRSEAPASLARLRVTGEMVWVGAESLRFEAQELAELARTRGHPLSQDSVRELHERTQGWAAGIVLMLEHAKLAGRIAEVPTDAPPKAVFDYLAGEIFERFEEKTREFLLRIACLPRMTAAVAEALSREPKAARLLVNLAVNNYFVIEVQSEEGRVYQLHPLLRAFLRSRAAEELPEAISKGEQQRAAALLREAGLLEDAVSVLVDCASWPEVAAIAAEQAQSMMAQGRSETLGRLLDLLPTEFVERDARLLYALGACRRAVSPRAARRCFEQAYQAFERLGDASGMRAAASSLIEATIQEFDDLALLDPWIGALSALVDKDGPSDAAATALARARLLRNPAQAGVAHAELLFDRALSALQHFLAGACDKALQAARDALSQAEADGVHADDGWLRAIAAAALLGTGERDTARMELQTLAAAPSLRRGDRAITSYLRAWLAWLEGDTPLAHREARAACALAAETGIPYLECFARIAWAELLAHAGDARDADAQLRAARTLGEGLGSFARFAVEFAAADLARLASDEQSMRHGLALAFRIGREHGYAYLPWWRREVAAELCAAALRDGIERDYARSLVRAQVLMPREAPLRVPEWPWRFRVHMLGRAHIERDAIAVESSGKGPGRPLELLKVLIAHGGQNVRAEQLADALWPHVDADYAHKSFTAALHRLRRLLDDDEAVILRDGRLSLNPARVWVDTWALEQVFSELDEVLRAPSAGGAYVERLVDEALRLYRGPFLPEEAEQPAYIACREQLRARLLRCLMRAARVHEDAGRHEAAVDIYQRCIDADTLFEAAYRNLMLLLQRRNENAEARAVYERLRMVLSTRLKAMPSPETQAVFAALSS